MSRFGLLLWLACYWMGMAAGRLDWRRDTWESNSVLACSGMVNALNWGYGGSNGYYSTVCEYEPALGTWVTCVYDTLDDMKLPLPVYFEKSLATVQRTCSSVGANVTFDRYSQSLQNASSFLKHEYNRHETLFEPVAIDKDLRRGLTNAYHIYTGNIDKSNEFGYFLYLYMVGFSLLAALFRLFDFTAVNSILFRTKIINYIRGYLTIPTLNGFHAADYVAFRVFSGLLPSRLESVVIICFFILNTFFLIIGFEADQTHLLLGSKLMQLTRYVGDRSGILAIAHVPLIILFGTRNNILEPLTGFKYTTFISLHKWIGRSMILDVCVHSIAYTWHASLSGSLTLSWHEKYWIYGSLATAVLIMLLIWSFGFIRRNRYEFFLYLHIALAIIFFFACWKHLISIGWTNCLLFSFAIWLVERLIRILRMIHFGVATASVQIIGDDLLRITIPKRSDSIHWSSKPGQYVFLHFMDLRIFWQSHPFTVIDAGHELIVVARAKKGATRTVLNRVTASCGSSGNPIAKIKVCVEGPYGSESPLHRFDNLLFLCGGSGLPGPLSHALDISRPLGPKNTLDLIISVRSIDILEAYKIELAKLQKLHINLQIYITQSAPTAQYGSISSNIHRETIITTLKPFATFHMGRPDISHLIASAIGHEGSLAVLACGPPIFVDKARDVTAGSVIRNPSRNIAYFEEYQCW